VSSNSLEEHRHRALRRGRPIPSPACDALHDRCSQLRSRKPLSGQVGCHTGQFGTLLTHQEVAKVVPLGEAHAGRKVWARSIDPKYCIGRAALPETFNQHEITEGILDPRVKEGKAIGRDSDARRRKIRRTGDGFHGSGVSVIE
jgi:hypothetical protein